MVAGLKPGAYRRFSMLAKDGSEEFDWVHGRAVQAGVELFGTGSATGQKCARFRALFRFLHLLEKILADGHAEVVEIFFIAKTSGHAATFHGRSGNVKSDLAQECFGLSSAPNGLLLAMGVIENAAPYRGAVEIENALRTAAGNGEEVCEKFARI